MPHTWGGSEPDPAPAVPPFLLPVFGPGVATFVGAGAGAVALTVAVGTDVTFAIVVATPFSVFPRSVIFVLNGAPHTQSGPGSTIKMVI